MAPPTSAGLYWAMQRINELRTLRCEAAFSCDLKRTGVEKEQIHQRAERRVHPPVIAAILS
jgi:hypothetical protein